MTSILYYLKSPTLPLGQVPLFLSNAHFPEHSVQGDPVALSPVLVWSLVPRSPPWLGGHMAAGMTKALWQHTTGTRWTWLTRSLSCTELTALPAHPELGQYLLTCWQGKDNGGHIFSSEIGQKDPLDNLYFIYMMSIRLQ